MVVTMIRRTALYYIFLQLTLFSIGATCIDVFWMNDVISSFCLTKLLQTFITGVILFIYSLNARKKTQMQSLYLLFSSLFLCLFVKRINPMISDSDIWVWLDTLIIIITVPFLVKNRQHLVRSLHNYMKTSSWGLMLAGIYTIFVFSNFSGLPMLWEFALDNAHQQDAVNLMTEMSALFGYNLLFFSTLHHFSFSGINA
ncbi:hypothetical protein [Pantoea sp. RHCKP32]|uniref:hypothetical protein n=1 Tax=Pantoea sp. RHCKP32 TaxID=3425182 RepID=UPI003DA130A1